MFSSRANTHLESHQNMLWEVYTVYALNHIEPVIVCTLELTLYLAFILPCKLYSSQPIFYLPHSSLPFGCTLTVFPVCMEITALVLLIATHCLSFISKFYLLTAGLVQLWRKQPFIHLISEPVFLKHVYSRNLIKGFTDQKTTKNPSRIKFQELSHWC